MSVQLLDKTRKINKLLHNNNSTKVVFNDICEVLVETLSSNILVISRKGKVLGVGLCKGVEEITELSKRLPVLAAELDEKEMRWLELSERCC